MTNNCTHQWDENGAVDGLVLASCMLCSAKQWHVTDLIYIGDGTHNIKDKINRANQLNKKDGFELIKIGKKEFVDTSLTNEKYFVKKETRSMDTTQERDTTSETPKVVNNVPPDPPDKSNPVLDPRIARMRLNTGNSERFDKSAQQVIEDVKTMSWTASFRKNGIPIGSVGRLRRRWEHMGLIAKPQTPKKEPTKTEGNKNTRRDYDAEKTEILKDYYGLSLKDFYAKQHLESNKWGKLKERWGIRGKAPRKANHKVTHPRREDTVPTYLCPYCETNWSQADALIKHLQAVHYDAPSKMALPPWCEAWGDSVKVAWLHVLEITGIR